MWIFFSFNQIRMYALPCQCNRSRAFGINVSAGQFNLNYINTDHFCHQSDFKFTRYLAHNKIRFLFFFPSDWLVRASPIRLTKHIYSDLRTYFIFSISSECDAFFVTSYIILFDNCWFWTLPNDVRGTVVYFCIAFLCTGNWFYNCVMIMVVLKGGFKGWIRPRCIAWYWLNIPVRNSAMTWPR